MNLLAIDPGNKNSAYVVVDTQTKKLITFGKVENSTLRDMIYKQEIIFDKAVIEMVASYGMAVGETVFETCLHIGRFSECCEAITDRLVAYIYRRDVKMCLCNSVKAKDGNIIQRLKDLYGDKGTKKEQGYFYGVSADVWQSFAVAHTYIKLNNL